MKHAQSYNYVRYERYNDLVIPVRREMTLLAHGWVCTRITQLNWPLVTIASGEAVDEGWQESADRTDPRDIRIDNARHAGFIGSPGYSKSYLPMTEEDYSTAHKRCQGLDSGDIDAQLLTEQEEWFDFVKECFE